MTTLTWKEILAGIGTAVFLFFFEFLTAGWLHDCPTPSPQIVTKVEYVDRVKTEVAYVPKEMIVYTDADGTTRTATERTDIDMNIGKQELTVKVNGKEHAIEKATDEQHVFDKNKLTLTQSSTAALDITVPTIDNTRLWDIGIGWSKDGAVGLFGFPVRGDVGSWIAGRSGNVMAGVNFKF